MSIFKDTFRDYVRRQLILREELIDIGNLSDEGERKNRLKKHIIKNEKGKFPYNFEIPAGAYYNYTLNKQCVLRMTSLVDYVEDVNLDIGDLGNQSFNRLKGAALSQNFILQGGVLSDYARTTGDIIRLRRADRIRESFPRPGLKTNTGYGDFAIGADASEDGYGIVPMPGIIDATVRTKSAYGSLREARVNFECHNRRQLEILEMLYMRPGYMVLLEWGWCPYINNSGKLETNLRLVENSTGGRIYTNNISQQEVFNHVNKLKETQSGNYDGMLGIIKNFGFQAREDGGFNCFAELTSIGEVIESLRIPPVSLLNPVIALGDQALPGGGIDITGLGGGYGNNVDLESTTATGDVVVVMNTNTTNASTGAYNSNFSVRGADQFEDNSSVLTRAEFDEAVRTEVFPSFNGLHGLIRTISNYTSATGIKGDEVLDNFLNNQIDYAEYIGNPILNSDGTYNEDVVGDLSYDERRNLNNQLQAVEESSGVNIRTSDASYQVRALKDYFRRLVLFQSANFEVLMTKLLGLSNVGELGDYIIRRNYSRGSGSNLLQSYIRWDAMCVLINSFLIPKIERGTTPVNLTADRIYDLNQNQCKIDPLLFVPISDYLRDNGDNFIFDFSADANVCILPLQFMLGPNARSSDDADPLFIENSLGYKPQIDIFPYDYVRALYNKVDKEMLYDDISVPVGSTGLVLNDTDKARRIGNIFLNVDMLLNISERNKNNDEYTLGQFINDVWGEVNKACPNHNFVLTDDKESKQIFIIDLPVDNSKIPNDFHTFIPYSNKNILRDFNYTSNVPSALSATIAIQAQDPRSIADIDGVTFAAFNRSIKNRLISNDIISSFARTQRDIRGQRSKIMSQQSNLRNQLQSYRSNFFRNIVLLDNDKSAGVSNIGGALQTYQKNSTYLSSTQKETLSFNSVIPLEFNATLDGIAGIVIGNIFKIQKDRLPRAYKKANIGFIVFGEEQEITAGGDWTTKINGKMTILPETPVKVKGIATTFAPETEDAADSFQTETVIVSNDTETTTLTTGQGMSGGTETIGPGSEVYLKGLIDRSIVAIAKGGKNAVVETIFEPVNDNVAYTSVRSLPYVDNTTGWFNDDTIVGMFNSYDDAGTFLGTIKTSTDPTVLNAPTGDLHGYYDNAKARYVETYEDDRILIKPEFVELYIENPPSIGAVAFRPNVIKETDTEGVVRFKPKTKRIAANESFNNNITYNFSEKAIQEGIVENHTTNIKGIWYCILFDPSVDSIFNDNWGWAEPLEVGDIDDDLLSKGINRPGNVIETPEGIITVGKLSEYSKNNDVWMRFDTLADSETRALKLFVRNVIEGNPDDVPEDLQGKVLEIVEEITSN